MKKIRFVWFLIMALSIGITSCMQDLGTQPSDYHNYNEITISGIDSSYFGDPTTPLTITPTITYSMDNSNDPDRYQYLWTMYNGQSAAIVLDTTRNWNVNYGKLPVGSHTITYRVTDRATGVFSAFSFNFSVRTYNFEGWLVLCNVGGTPRLDMASRNVSGTLETADSITIINDILSASGSSLKLTGTPLNVCCFAYAYNNVILDSSTMKPTKIPAYGIYISTTGNGTTRIDPETFNWDPTMGIGFEFLSGSAPGPMEYMYPIANAPYQQVYVYNNGNIYYNFPWQSFRYGFPINRIRSTSVTPFKASPYMALAGSNIGKINLLYDIDSSRFVAQNTKYDYCYTLADNNKPENKFPWNRTNMDMIYMGNYKQGRTGGLGVAIMKYKDTGTPCILTFSCDGIISPAKATKELYTIDNPTVSKDILNAEHYAITNNWTTLFYSIGNTLYQYAYGTGRVQVMKTYSGTISMLKIDKSASTDYSKAPSNAPPWLSKDYLLVGTSDGVLSSYQVQATLTDPLIENFSYRGFGSIVDVSYRVRN